MEDVHRAADSVLTEADHLERILDADELTPERIELALAVAKRGRRASNLLVRALARLRDTATAQEGTST